MIEKGGVTTYTTVAAGAGVGWWTHVDWLFWLTVAALVIRIIIDVPKAYRTIRGRFKKG